MKFSIEARAGYLYAAVSERDTPQETRAFQLAVHSACREHSQPKIMMSVRRSRAIFKPEDYGLDGSAPGYVTELVSPACQIALVGDTDEVNTANEYIELVARQQGVNVRAFRDERAALHWLQGVGGPSRRYRFTRIVISGAPDDAGIYSLFDGEELVYYGRADGAPVTIRARLLDHYYNGAQKPTHYSWEICKDPAAREAELLAEHRRAFGRPPKHNAA
jgi:hypothetical protein